MNNIINPLIGEYLDDQDFEMLESFVNTDELNGARLLVERNMIGLERDDPKFIVLNEAYDQIINEIEITLDV